MNLLPYVKYLLDRIHNHFYKPKIKILHNSEHYLVIDKPFDVKINSNKKMEITVQTLLKESHPSLANENLCHEYYFPHRLDFATSGLMCVPKHKEACRIISNTFSSRQSKKYYVAIVRGLFSKEVVVVDMPIGEDTRGTDVQKMCTADSEFCVKSRSAKTIFRALEEGLYDGYPATKILIRPVTGRRHQIRVHCSFLGHTIVGDYTYSNRKDTEPFRMFLHSLRLVLPNALETIDVETGDPFRHVRNWEVFKKINEIDQLSYNFEKYL